MRNNREVWEQMLAEEPHPSRGYSQQLKQKVNDRLLLQVQTKSQKNRSKTVALISTLGGVVAVAIILFIVLQPGFSNIPLFSDDQRLTNENESDQTDGNDEAEDTNEHDNDSTDEIVSWFDIDTAQVGDQFGTLTISSIEPSEAFTVGTVVSFEGSIRLSGTYEYYYNDANYNAGDLLFYTDEASTLNLPMPDRYENSSSLGFILQLNEDLDPEDIFGPRGSSGTVELDISSYSATVTEAWGGVINPMAVENIVSIETIPPNDAAKLNDQAVAHLNDFPQLQLELSDWQDEDAWVLTEWFMDVQQTFMDSLPFDERRIHPNDRDVIADWMREIATDSLTESLIERHVPEVDGGFIVAGGNMDLIPTAEILAIEPRSYTAGELAPLLRTETTEAGEQVWVFDAKLNVDSSIPWHTIEVQFTREDGRWKLAHFQTEWIQ